MISAGRNVRNNTEPLVKVPVKYLYDALRNPRHDVATLLSQLHIARSINPKLYPSLKLQLPYFVCAMFNPPFRKTENFAYTQYFIVDIDHISEKGLVLDTLRDKIKHDSRTMLCFVSPSGDGLKVMFRLSDKCYDAGIYKVFYKLFLSLYSQQYDLQQVIDSQTCDVARACFMSSDVNAYFNPNAECINITDYIDSEENVQQAFDLKRDTERQTHENEKIVKKADHCKEPSNDILSDIKARLGFTCKKKKDNNAFVPQELNDIIDELRTYVESFDIQVNEIQNIQYGKKLRMLIGSKRAEINLFYGKRGFTVVQSPRSGTDMASNEIASMVIQKYLDKHC